MRALTWHGKHDVRVDTVPDPEIVNPRDAILEITSTAICGSDLHLYDGVIPGMMPGDIVGHEFMGRVVETGPKSTLQKGQRVVVPFTISCGHCFFCEKQLYSACDNSNPVEKQDISENLYGHAMSGLFGYSHLTGGYPGGQAEYVRVPFSDVGPIVIPDGLDDDQVLFLSDILPTGWMAAENAQIEEGDTVAVWGCGPVGLFAIQSALLMGAGKVIAIDEYPTRLDLARKLGAEVIDFKRTHVLEALMEMSGGLGPDAVIDAVGMESARLRPRHDPRQHQAERRHGRRQRACAPRGDHGGPQGRAHLRARRLWRLSRQVPARRGDGEGRAAPHRPDPCAALHQGAAAADRRGRDRHHLPDLPPPAAGGGAARLRELPLQPERMDQGRPEARYGGELMEGRKLAVITGASSGIGLELARCAAGDGCDLVIAANEPQIHAAASELGALGVTVEPVEADLGTEHGVAALWERVAQRRIDYFVADAGRGLGDAFLDQNWDEVEAVIHLNVTGTTALLHRAIRQMKAANHGRILILGSIAGLMPGSFQAVYNATKAYLDTLSWALRDELKDSEVTVTCLMPGPDRHPVLPPRPHAGHAGRPRRLEGRPRDGRPHRLERDAPGLLRRHLGLHEQGAGDDGGHPAARASRPHAPQPRRTGGPPE